ncbi:MAG: helix-turn-helix domain-containing protein [Nitrospira sp.]|nr:helix-turn-helix domain-containing protein [Nitrospira sp.]
MRAKSNRFDVVGFHLSIDGARRARHLNWKQVAEETGVGASTLTRIARGKAPDAVALAVLARWANVNPTVFLLDEPTSVTQSSLGEVLARVRADPTLPEDVKAMLETVIVSAMERASRVRQPSASSSTQSPPAV